MLGNALFHIISESDHSDPDVSYLATLPGYGPPKI